MDYSGYPKKIVDGVTYYFVSGVWIKPLDIDNLSNYDHFHLNKIQVYGDPPSRGSKEAMIEGCYKFLEILQKTAEIPADTPYRFIAKVQYKPNPESSYVDFTGSVFETVVRINPLFNKSSTGNCITLVKSHGKYFAKRLEVFNNLLLGKQIYLKKIELVERPDYSSYAYDWDLL